MAGLAANEDAPHRAGIADPLARRAALDFCRRRIGEIGQMSLAGVDDQHAGVARRRQHRADRLHRARELRDIVAERFAKAARLHEVALHVDDDERGGGPVEIDRLRLGDDDAVPLAFAMPRAPNERILIQASGLCHCVQRGSPRMRN